MSIDDSAAVAGTPNRRAIIARWAPRVRWPALALFFAGASVVQTWPLVKHAGSSLTVWWFFPFDAWQFLWDLWWVKHSVLAVNNPFHTDGLLYPQGSDLYLHPLTFVNGVLSIPFQLLTGNLILSWNLLALLCFVLSGLGTYALSYRVTGNHLAGLVSGFIFAFAPFTMMRLGGHWNIFATWPIPFFLLFLLRFRESGRARDAAGVGAFWGILTLNWLEFASDAALFLGLFFAYWTIVYLLRRERRELAVLWRGAAITVGVWLVLSAPELIGALRNIESGDFYQPGGAESFSADLLTFFTPSPLWGTGTAPLIGGPNPNHLPVGSVEDTAYLGGMPLLLATVSLLTARKNLHRVLIWVCAFVLFAVLALGPYLYINDSSDFSLLGVSFSVPLPYQLYDHLPLFGTRRVPARMIVFGIMALSILAGIGLDLLMGWVKPRWRMAAPLVAVLVLGTVWLEYWNPPVFLTPLSTPQVFDDIRNEPGDFTVLDAPLGRRTGWTFAGDATGGPIANFDQAFYEKATFGGYLSRVSDEGFTWFLEQPGLHYLACANGCGGQPTGDDLNGDLVRRVFSDNRIRYVIVHRLQPDGQGLFYVGDPEVQGMDRYVREVVGMVPIYSDSILTVYRAPAGGQ